MNLTEFQAVMSRPIAYYRIFADVAGSAAGGIFLSQLYYWSDGRGLDPDGWIYKSLRDWQTETGLNRGEVETAAERLTDMEIIEKKTDGPKNVTWYRVNREQLVEAVNRVIAIKSEAGSGHLSCKSVCGITQGSLRNSASQFAELDKPVCDIPQTLPTKSTSETTAETTQAAPAPVLPRAGMPAHVPVRKGLGSALFDRPSIEQIIAYGLTLPIAVEQYKLTPAEITSECEAFFDYNESKGWKVGGETMKSWQAALRTRFRNMEKYGTLPKRSAAGNNPNPHRVKSGNELGTFQEQMEDAYQRGLVMTASSLYDGDGREVGLLDAAGVPKWSKPMPASGPYQVFDNAGNPYCIREN